MYYKNLDIRIKNIIISIVLIYILVYIGIIIVPAEAYSGNFYKNLYLNISFIIYSITFSIIINNSIKYKNIKVNNVKIYKHNKYYLFIAFVFSLFGIILLIYDRLFLRGIDYSQGFRAARYLWLNSQGGNFAGIAGNILNSFGYYSLVMLATDGAIKTKFMKLLATVSSLVTVIGIAMLNGGRSNILVGITLFISVILVNERINFISLIKTKLKILFVVFAVSIVPVIIVTNSSASLSDLDIKTHFELEVISLFGLNNYESIYFNIDYFESILYTLYYLIIYLVHGQWTAQISTDIPEQQSYYFLYPIKQVLSDLGLIEVPPIEGYFSSSGAFISLPGALFYDFGYIGHFLLSIFLGCMLGFAFRILQNGMIIGGIASSYVLLMIILFLMSPMMLAHGFSILIFVFVPFIFFGIINLLDFKIFKFA